MASSIIFGVSSILILGLVSLSLWEAKRGKKLYAQTREELDVQTSQSIAWVKKHTSQLNFETAERMYHNAIHLAALIVLRLIKVVEGKAIRVLDWVRGKKTLPKREPTSTFLKHVSEHKDRQENSPHIPSE